MTDNSGSECGGLFLDDNFVNQWQDESPRQSEMNPQIAVLCDALATSKMILKRYGTASSHHMELT